jgi:hypothetical protein
MPTLVKQQVDSKPASTPTSNGLAVAVLLLALAVAGALLSSVFPLPPDEAPATDAVPASDVNFFAP